MHRSTKSPGLAFFRWPATCSKHKHVARIVEDYNDPKIRVVTDLKMALFSGDLDREQISDVFFLSCYSNQVDAARVDINRIDPNLGYSPLRSICFNGPFRDSQCDC